MIRKLTMDSNQELLQFLFLQNLAYQLEAKLAGITDIIPLQDSIFTLQVSSEAFYGYFVEEELLGAVSYLKQDGVITISRMMVHPQHFRQGIANRLLSFVLALEVDCFKFLVSTGSWNLPALNLYHKYGFVEQSRHEIKSGMIMLLLVK